MDPKNHVETSLGNSNDKPTATINKYNNRHTSGIIHV